jgi:hypothetical protein
LSKKKQSKKSVYKISTDIEKSISDPTNRTAKATTNAKKDSAASDYNEIRRNND